MIDRNLYSRMNARAFVASLIVVLFALVSFTTQKAQASEPDLGIPQFFEGDWMIRINQSDYEDIFNFSTSQDGFTAETNAKAEGSLPGYILFHLELDRAVSAISFNIETEDDTEIPIELFDAAANKLWEGTVAGSEEVSLTGLEARGELIFRIKRGEVPKGITYSVSNIELTEADTNPRLDEDGFIMIESLGALRGYAQMDSVKVRLRPGTYRLNKTLYNHFIEFTGNGSEYDLTGVRIQVDTELFSDFGTSIGFYSVIDLTGDYITMEGVYVETYGDQPGIQGKNKLFNITGKNVTLRNATVRTEGSVPWGYGSLFGIGGGIVKKMNGIRIGAPADGTRLIGCTVHMRAMGHGIFVQGAKNTLIRDCHVDGLLRPTSDILAETSGLAYERDFKIVGTGEGVPPTPKGKIPPNEMVSLSEDGIRLYPSGGEGIPTGRTTIINSTVTQMRRGICTGFGQAPNLIIDSQATETVAAGFHVGSNDRLISVRADAKYGEALTIASNSTENADVDMEILDSRGGMGNDLLAKINGSGHHVTLRTTNSDFIPPKMVIEVGSNRGYLGKNAGYGVDRPDGTATDVTLRNYTNTKVIIPDRVTDTTVTSYGEVPEGGLEPPRPQWPPDFESGASTNSATQASILTKSKYKI